MRAADGEDWSLQESALRSLAGYSDSLQRGRELSLSFVKTRPAKDCCAQLGSRRAEIQEGTACISAVA